MCLIVFSYRQHPKYELVFAANRDEYYDRPTRQAQFWDDHPRILAGKDLKAGGTWMGITTKGTFAALTNFRDSQLERTDPPSRGHLVLDYLKDDHNPAGYLLNVDKKSEQYMGFNLLAGTMDQLAYYSNRQNNIKLLDSGLYGLSNHLLDTSWPKVEWAKKDLYQIVQEDIISEEALFELLANDKEAAVKDLPDTGISQEIEKKISPIFIKNENYGTRCSTLLLVEKNGNITFSERRFKAGTMDVKEENRYRFSIEK